MKYLLIFFLNICTFQLAAQNIYISRVFASEPQNKTAKQLPALLLKAYANGDIKAYYPEDLNRKVTYAQFLQHFGEGEKAATAVESSPAWFCDEEKIFPSKQTTTCFSVSYQLGKSRSRTGKIAHRFVRLLFDSACGQANILRMGPVFKFPEIAKLDRQKYAIANPRNQAVKYSPADILLLGLYADRTMLGK